MDNILLSFFLLLFFVLRERATRGGRWRLAQTHTMHTHGERQASWATRAHANYAYLQITDWNKERATCHGVVRRNFFWSFQVSLLVSGWSGCLCCIWDELEAHTERQWGPGTWTTVGAGPGVFDVRAEGDMSANLTAGGEKSMGQEMESLAMLVVWCVCAGV